MSTLQIKGPNRKGALIPRPPGGPAPVSTADMFINFPEDYDHPGRDEKTGKLKGKKPRPVGESFDKKEVHEVDGWYLRMAIHGEIEILSPQSVVAKVKGARAVKAAQIQARLGGKPPSKPAKPVDPPKGGKK